MLSRCHGSPASPPPPLVAQGRVLGGDTSPNEARQGLMSCRHLSVSVFQHAWLDVGRCRTAWHLGYTTRHCPLSRSPRRTKSHLTPIPVSPAQVCILECEGEAVPRATWELCAAAAGRAAPRPRDLQDASDPWHGAAAPAVPVSPLQVSELLRHREDEDEGVEPAPDAFPQPPEDISRQLGGFPRGTRGSWPAPTARGVQKRYGGFIGVRKSARKWNNQKRFSEFLKQYLGMSPRSTFRHRIPAPSARHRQN
ncbi:prepronociceptin isoform 1-T1 [Morphnus guianensis]